MDNSSNQLNIPLQFRGLFEHSAGALACRTAIVAATVGDEEFAGMALGYLGNGAHILEPFHSAFSGKQTRLLLLGDRNALTGARRHFEDWSRPVRQAVAAARSVLRQHCTEDAERVWIARAPVRLRSVVLENSDVLLLSKDPLDERVWMSVSAHIGSPAGMEF